jgi:nitrogen fixation/metabolism regulation signal transduction histidine kinase
MNRYHLKIILRVILITLNSIALAWIYTHTNRPATTLFLFIVLIIQTVSLVYFCNRVNRDLSNFLISLQENNTTLTFPSTSRIEKNFQGLTHNLNRINSKIQQAAVEREQKNQYMQIVVDQIAVGLISFNESGAIEFINKSAKQILGVSYLKNVSALLDKHPALLKYFSSMEKSEQGMLKISVENKDVPLSVKTKILKINEVKIKLITFQNIKNELDAQELDSWRKLIRILRHEIMNSITPITTLTTAIKRIFYKEGDLVSLNDLKKENIEDAITSADVIEERSRGLIGFVEKFRSLTDLPQPKITNFKIGKVFENIRILFSKELNAKNVSLKIENVADLSLEADEQLIEQVLINLVKNSIEAINHQNGEILLKAFSEENSNICINVIDNGEGIKPEDIDKIFIPSYSKKENGSGIGLSISKQIMQLHNGNIGVKSSKPGFTMFELNFE